MGKLEGKLGKEATDYFKTGADVEQVEMIVPDVLASISKLRQKHLEALWLVMGVTEDELKQQLIEKGIPFAEQTEKYPSKIEKKMMKAGTVLDVANKPDGITSPITLSEDTEFTVITNAGYTKGYGRCALEAGEAYHLMPLRALYGPR